MTQGIELMPQKLTILSYTIWTMSKDFLDVTEYTRTKPCIPMACLELSIEYSSCRTEKGKYAVRVKAEGRIEDGGARGRHDLPDRQCR